MLPEERAREKIDKQLTDAGWDIVSRNEYIPQSTSAIKEGLMKGNTESDYLLFVDDKAIAVVEAKREENPLGPEVAMQAEDYARSPQDWYGLWYKDLIPLVYMANGNKIYFKPENMQYTVANKLRGAYYKMSLLSDEDRAKGVITASAGNHAQGVAYAAKAFGAKATIVMPTMTPFIKVNRTKG